ncbi:MAG TPA: Lrp/AsnC family transcriptional regulator [Candidatus Nanoarchaeia archaeon]|nr:Lrp/AsnC family transcriptional regulator [Candidatus Nanoarchaeia archaeon]
MNLKDKKLLYYLDYGARSNLSFLSKKLQLSKQNIHYKIKKLEDQKLIESYITVFDIHKLGYLTYRAYIRLGKVTDKDTYEISQSLIGNKSILWLVSIEGTWDFEIVFVAKNYIEFANQFEEIKQSLGDKLVKFNLSMTIINLHYKKDYLINQDRKLTEIAYYGKAPQFKEIDRTDIGLIMELSKNCRRSNQEIGKLLGISHHTVKSRIERMEKEGIIQSHRTKINFQKMGYKYMKAALYLYPISKDKEKELMTFLSSFPEIVYIVKILGDWNLEIEAHVKNEEEFSKILRIIRNKYPELINDYYTFQVTKEIKLNYVPNAAEILS